MYVPTVIPQHPSVCTLARRLCPKLTICEKLPVRRAEARHGIYDGTDVLHLVIYEISDHHDSVRAERVDGFDVPRHLRCRQDTRVHQDRELVSQAAHPTSQLYGASGVLSIRGVGEHVHAVGFRRKTCDCTLEHVVMCIVVIMTRRCTHEKPRCGGLLEG